MRIEQEVADRAAKQTTRHHFVLVRERVPEIDLFVERSTSAPFAAELAVEGVQLFGCGGELVLETLDGLQSDVGIHLDERHALMVEH